MKNVKFTTEKAMSDSVALNALNTQLEGKEITFVYKGEEYIARAKKRGDSVYKIISGSLIGKEIKLTALVCRILIMTFGLFSNSCDTSVDDMLIDDYSETDTAQRIILDSDNIRDLGDSALHYFQLKIDYSTKKEQYEIMFFQSRNEVFMHEADMYLDSALYCDRALRRINISVQGN